jgi:predicted nucleotidyltransferase component of viral defense system
MLNKATHESVLNRILLDIYTNRRLAFALGFKGGTAAYFFNGLPRFSTDLDFNLISPNDADYVMEALHDILMKYGTLKDEWRKHHTLYFLLSYGTSDYNVKVEISTRTYAADTYGIQSYYGLPVTVLEKSSMTAHKLVAITDRKKLAHRDLFDAWFFLKSGWPVNDAVIFERTGKDRHAYFSELARLIDDLEKKKVTILDGLGEVLNADQKVWAKKHLLQELRFLLLSTAGSNPLT